MKPITQIHLPISLECGSDLAIPLEQDIWFDAIDYIEIDETWFDAQDDYLSKEKGEELIPFTEDCLRCIKQFIKCLGDIKENELITSGLSKAFPYIPINIILAADSIYTAIMEKRNIDNAILHSLWLTSTYLLPDNNSIFQLAYFIRETFLTYIENSFIEKFLVQNDNRQFEYISIALAVLAVTFKYCMRNNKAPQRIIFKIPTFFGHLMIRASRYWNVICDLAQHTIIPTETKRGHSACEIDTSIEMKRHIQKYLFKNKFQNLKNTLISHEKLNDDIDIRSFSSNSTIYSDRVTKATVQNKPIKKINKNANTADKLHAFAIEVLKTKSGIQELLYCVTKKTETQETDNKSIITHIHMNTKCDAILSQRNSLYALSATTFRGSDVSKADFIEKDMNTVLNPKFPENYFTMQIKDIWEKARYLYDGLLNSINQYDLICFPKAFAATLNDSILFSHSTEIKRSINNLDNLNIPTVIPLAAHPKKIQRTIQHFQFKNMDLNIPTVIPLAAHPKKIQRTIQHFQFKNMDLNIPTVIPLAVHPEKTQGTIQHFQFKNMDYATPIIMTKENINIIYIMRGRGFLDDEKAMSDYSKEELMIAMSSYLYGKNSSKILTKAERFKEIARSILYDKNFYGGIKGEEISQRMIESVVRYWIFHTILETSFNNYIINNMESYLSHYTIDVMLQMFSFERLHQDKKLNIKNIPSEKWADFNLMWFSCLKNEIPFLNFSHGEIKNISLESQEFANLYTGSRFLFHAAKLNDFSKIEAIEIGKAMWDIVIIEGVEIDKTPYFLLPSLFFSAKQHPKEISFYDNSPEIINKYIKYRENIQLTLLIQSLQQDLNNKLEKYKEAVKLWSNKEKLAEEIILRCPKWELPDLSDLADPIRSPEQRYEKVQKIAKQFYMHNIMKPCKTAPENLNDEYVRLTKNVAKSFSDIENYLIWSAFETLDREEIIFMSSKNAMVYPVTFSVKYPRRIPFMNDQGIFKNPSYELDKVDIFSIIVADEERFYCLKENPKDVNNAYKVIRINYNNAYELIKSGRDFHEKIKFNHHIHHNPYVITMYGFDYLIYYNRTLSKQHNPEENKNFYSLITDKNKIISKNGDIESLVNYLTKIHQDTFYNSLYEFGNDQSDIEKVWEILKHIIPFYDCIESIVNKNLEEATRECLIDIILAIPTIIAGKFSIGLLRRFYKGSIVLKKQITLISKPNFKEITRLPSIYEMTTLNKNVFHTIYPRFELVTSMWEQLSQNLINYMNKNKISTQLISKIISSRLTINPPILSNQYSIKRLSHSNLYVPVKVIGKRRGHDIYALINPNTGEIFGRHYILSKNNILIEYNKLKGRYPSDKIRYPVNKQFCIKSSRARRSPCIYNTDLNENSILEQTGFQADLYRADKLSFEEIKRLGGFKASEDFSSVEKMIREDSALIVSEELTGALRYINNQNELYHVYKIDSNNIRGASLNGNIEMNGNGIKKFLNVQSENNIDWVYETNGANTLYEAHVYLKDITLEKISYIGTNTDHHVKELIRKLKIGRWSAYF